MASLEKLITVLVSKVEIERQVAEHHAQAADLEYGAACDEAEAARIEEVSEAADADALLAGKTPRPHRDKKVEDLRRNAKTKRAAAEKARAHAAKVAADIPIAQSAVTSTALSWAREYRDAGVADLIAVLSGALDPLAQMIASDVVRDWLIGKRFQFDPREHDPADLWSGAVLADRLLKAIPPRLRQEGFAETIRARSEGLAAEIIHNLKEGNL